MERDFNEVVNIARSVIRLLMVEAKAPGIVVDNSKNTMMQK